MRSRSSPWILLAIVMLLVLPAIAAADIGPIPKPPTPPATPPTPPATPPTPPATPPTPPATPPTPPATPPTPPATPPTPPATPPTPPATPPIVEQSDGGRDQSGSETPLPPPPDPTPLAVVSAADVVPSTGSETPIWKIALLALLAAGEAFLIVRLVRHRPDAPPLSTA